MAQKPRIESTAPSPESNPAQLDSIDRKILNILQTDNTVTNLALAEQIGLSAPPCLRRVRRLRDDGIITKDVSLVDPFKVGHGLVVFASITLEKQREDLLESFERKMRQHDEVLQCYFVSGDCDYLILINVADVTSYNAFARRVFALEPNIRMFRSSFCLSRVKFETKITLAEE